MRFDFAIVRRPGPKMVDGLSGADLGRPDFELALKQHDAYVRALTSLGVEVTVLEADSRFPDCCFVEDTAVLAERVAVVTNLGAPSRQGEEAVVRDALGRFYDETISIEPPGTLEGGDVMRVDDHFYIGLSKRTNEEGARQLIAALERHGYTGSTVEMKEMLHLKTGVSYLENGVAVAAGEFQSSQELKSLNKIPIDPDEAYAANSLWINDTVLVPAGFPKTLDAIRGAGMKTIELDMSEFRKLDGGLSCLSLRFSPQKLS